MFHTQISSTVVVSSSATFNYVSRVRPPLGYDSTNEHVIIGFCNNTDAFVKYSALDVSGATPALSGATVASTLNNSNYNQYGGYAFDSNEGWLVSAPLYGTANAALAVTNTATTSNYTAWLGVAQNAATGAAEAVTIKSLGTIDRS